VFHVGLLAGSLLIAIGLVAAVVRGRFVARAVTVAHMARGIATVEPSAIMALGLLTLLLTPVAGVVVLGIVFARDGDLRFALVALAVAVLLGIGVSLGRA
jgi:uncharacterized membrane protein